MITPQVSPFQPDPNGLIPLSVCGVATAPTWAALAAGDISSGTLAVANGGTGSATLAANNVLLGNGTSAPLTVAPGSNGNILTSNGTTWVSLAPASNGWTTSGSDLYRSSGNVGIGTASPTSLLQVTSGVKTIIADVTTSGTSPLLQLNSGNVNNWVRIGSAGSSLAILTGGSDATSTSPAVFLSNNGNVGIGTTSPSLWTPGGTGSLVQANGYFSSFRSGEVGFHLFNNGGVQEWAIRQPASGTSHDLRISTFNSGTVVDRMVVTTNGSVGIGTTNPSAKLQVAGQINASQYVVSSGAIVDFNNGNVQVVQSAGGAAITLNNMVDGGAYTVIVTDATARTYTFTNCATSKFLPANGITTASTTSIYTILKLTIASTVTCFINWSTGY